MYQVPHFAKYGKCPFLLERTWIMTILTLTFYLLMKFVFYSGFFVSPKYILIGFII